jgi:hypothetical protein
MAMRDAIRPDEPRYITTDEPALAPPSHHLDMPDLRLPESKWARALIVLVYGLAFFAPITFSTEKGLGFVLFLWGFLYTVVYPFDFWNAPPAAGLLVVCWLANPLFWIGMFLIGCRQRSRRHLGGVFGACAVLAALFWFLPWNDLAPVGPAYLLWCGSFVLLAVTGLIGGMAPAPFDPREVWRQPTDDEMRSTARKVLESTSSSKKSETRIGHDGRTYDSSESCLHRRQPQQTALARVVPPNMTMLVGTDQFQPRLKLCPPWGHPATSRVANFSRGLWEIPTMPCP